MATKLIFVLIFSIFAITVKSGPVNVRIETDNKSSFYIGSGPRQTFELVEEYKPLSVAFNPSQKSKPVPISVAVPPPEIPKRESLPISEPAVHIINVGGQDVRIIDHPKTQQQIESETNEHIGMGRMPMTVNHGQTHSVVNFHQKTENGPQKSHWLDWTRWSPCSDGERMRIRSCLEIDEIKCEGPSTEIQKCFSIMHSDIPFAKDPLVIEKEILGVDPSSSVV